MPVLTIYPATPRERLFRWSDPRCDIGRAPNNQLQLEDESVSSYHARIEKRGNEYWVVDLKSTNGTLLNGAPVQEARLQDGDLLQFGMEVQARFARLPEEVAPAAAPTADVTVEAAPGPAPETPPGAPGVPPPVSPVTPGAAAPPQGVVTALAQRGVQCPSCGALIPFSVNFCPRCGLSLASTAPLAFPVQPQPVGFVRPMEHPGAPSVGMLPLLALLCGVFGFIFGIPAVLAIILGLLAIGHIRRHGGLESDRRQATWGVFLGFFWVVVMAAGISWYVWSQVQKARRHQMAQQQDIVEKQIAENEAAVITDLKGIACAQRFAKVVRLKDPNQTGKGQYLTLKELGEMRPPFFKHALAEGTANGYRFTVRDVSEANYVAVAEPERYGHTGKRTFTVDASGVIRAQDLKGRTYAQAGGQLPVATEVKSAYDQMDNAIASEAIAHAKRLAEQGKYEACRQILDDVAVQFAMTTAAQELNSLKKSVDPFIIEAQASRKHQQAQEAHASGDLKLAISLLKEITELYPTYTRISAVTDALNKYQTALIQKLDQEAKELFERAEAYERDGKPEEALKLYVEIEKNYPTTDWANRIKEQRPALQKSIRERAAEQLFAQARDLSVNNAAREIVNLLQQLQRNYTDTDYVQRNRESIVAFYQKAQAELYRLQAIEQMKAGREADALARLEDACANNPDVRVTFRDLFLQLYPRVARKRMEEGDARDALRLYTSYLMLEPPTNEVNLAVLAKLQFDVAKIEFAQGRYLEALQLLIGAKPEFAKDPEFNDLYGSVEVARGNYLDALEYFNKAIAAKPNVGNYYARRGYAQLLLALQIEQEAMIAYAGLLRAPTNMLTTTMSQPSTNASPANIIINIPSTDGTTTATSTTNAPPAEDFAPVFNTVLPPTATGLKPEMQVRYDAAAAQNLLDQILDLLDSMAATNVAMRVRTTARSAQAAQAASSTSSRRTGTQGTDTNTAGATPAGPNPENVTATSSRERLRRIKTTMDFGKALSSMRQRILDCNKRREQSVLAMQRMAQLFAAGNRDLAKAIQLKADRAPQLMEILKATEQHERLVNKAIPKITAYLKVETDVIEKVTQMAESIYRNMRTSTTTALDPTPMLDSYFTRWFDRTEFDQGVQLLREAAAIKVPLENYSIVPPPPSTATASAAPAAQASKSAASTSTMMEPENQ
ncbi:MAG: FHA domain-containing protein [Verrucomicrobiae bacterium]|nr:FHA domain-containing protein [Verrucomicrobiae bacterium]